MTSVFAGERNDMVSTKPPSGMRDYLPDAVVKRRYVLGKVESVFQRYGFFAFGNTDHGTPLNPPR
jgi:hypothetical protein